MIRFPLVLALALALPAAALAEEIAFDCGTPDPAHPELGAHLVKLDGQDKGTISDGEQDIEAMVLPGLGTLTFLHIGDGFTIQYVVNPEAGTYNYSASGSKMGDKRGECTVVSG